MLFLQILGVVASLAIGTRLIALLWKKGRVDGIEAAVAWLFVAVGAGLVSLGAWQAVAYGWIG